eukprot:GHVO01022362.1.p1 GENE.GHVO01022362.1~~GHVO01022362.1.p1  ORF type:complete len:233 (+),score=35.61 GHVO01022362.1:154-852(+)
MRSASRLKWQSLTVNGEEEVESIVNDLRADLHRYRKVITNRSRHSKDEDDPSASDLRIQIETLIGVLGLTEALEDYMKRVENEDHDLHRSQVIVPGLCIGGFTVASKRTTLYSYEITHIVCCVDIAPVFPKHFHYLILPAEDKDEQDIKQYFAEAVIFIRDAIADGGKVLVHCGAGVSRAPTVCAAFLISELNMAKDEALGLIRSVRPHIEPNEGFLRQLDEFEATHIGSPR